MEIVVFILSPISGRLADRYGSRVLSSVGLALNASALIWFSTLTETSSYGAVLISLMLFGIGRALFMAPNTSSIMGSVPAEKVVCQRHQNDAEYDRRCTEVCRFLYC